MYDQVFSKGVPQKLYQNIFTRTGYTFDGWSNTQNGEKLYEDKQSIPVTEDITLYAVWKGNVTNITLYFNNTTSFPSVNQTVNISYDSDKFNTSLTPPTKPGYTFLGYNNSTESSSVQVINNTLKLVQNAEGYTLAGKWNNTSENVELWAAWKPNVTKIKLHFNNSTDYTETAAIDYNSTDYNGTKPSLPKWTGHTFLGYNSTKVGGVQVINNTLKLVQNAEGYTSNGKWNNTSENAELWAVWKANITNITLNFKNGSSAPNDKQAVSITYDTNQFSETLSPPIYAGYTFKGYFNESIGGVLVINDALKLVSNEVNYTSSGKWINTSSNITLYAHWIQNPPSDNSSGTSGSSTTYTGWVIYTVYFDSCGGSHIDNQTNLHHGDKVTEPINPTRDGYIFDGWYTEDSYKWDFNNDTLNQSFTLYAKWKLIERPLSPTVKQHHCCWIAIIILLITAAVTTAVIIKKRHDKKKEEENYDVLS